MRPVSTQKTSEERNDTGRSKGVSRDVLQQGKIEKMTAESEARGDSRAIQWPPGVPLYVIIFD